MALEPPPRALFFDVFGTCVNWRHTVINELHTQSQASLNSTTLSLPSPTRLRASEMTPEHWTRFAQQWRNTYKSFTRKLAANPSIPWVSVDEHHLNSLQQLLVEWQIEGLWEGEELRRISLVWHRLEPWSDSAMGVELLNRRFYTCTLSNGNVSLLDDLKSFSGIPFTHLFSAEMFGSYKPAPAVYLGAVKKFGFVPEECVMVAAHLPDLQAAKENGLRTVYVERPGEEDWDDEEAKQARRDGWVDVWIEDGNGNNGFVTVAERLGVDISSTPTST